MWQKTSPWVHGLLDVASFFPGLSVVTGVEDAAIHTPEGEAVEGRSCGGKHDPRRRNCHYSGQAANTAVGAATRRLIKK